MLPHASRLWNIIVLSGVALASTGCISTGTSKALANKPPRGPVSNVIPLWSEAVLRQNNVPVAQGFSAKVYLYGPDSKQPTTSPGTFTIYAYDDTNIKQKNQERSDPKPDRVWEFKESELCRLLKKDAIGWSYSLWLPFGPPADAERRCTLVLCFTPEQGPRVLSESALVTLPPAIGGGKKSALPVAEKKSAADNEESKQVRFAYGLLDNSP